MAPIVGNTVNRDDIAYLPAGAVVLDEATGETHVRSDESSAFLFTDGASTFGRDFRLVWLPKEKKSDLSNPEDLAWLIYLAHQPESNRENLRDVFQGYRWENVANWVLENFTPNDKLMSLPVGEHLKAGTKVKVTGTDPDGNTHWMGETGTVFYNDADSDGDYLVQMESGDRAYIHHTALSLA